MAKEPATQSAEIQPMRANEQFRQYLARRAAEPQRLSDRSAEIVNRQLDAILSAETEEQMWKADDFESTGGRDLEDVEMEVRGFDVNPATDRFKAPLGHFFIIEAIRLDTGETVIWNTSAPLLMGKLAWLESRDRFPARVVIKGTPTPNGTVLKLEEIPNRPAQAKAESA